MSNGMSSARRRAQRLNLYRIQAGLCHWCKKTMKMNPDGTSKPSPQWATIDHLHPRGDTERGKHPGKYTHVLACWKCNFDRNIAFQKAQPLEVLWKASGRSPASHSLNNLEHP